MTRRILICAAAALLLLACQSNSNSDAPAETAEAATEAPVNADAVAAAPPVEADAQSANAADTAAAKPAAGTAQKGLPELDPANNPVIACDSPEFSYGVVRPGDVIEHTFTVKNIGSKPLHIKRTEAG